MLRAVVSREKAAIGLFLTLEQPTSEMIKDMKATDPYVSPVWKHAYPKIQILTINELLNGIRPDIPPTSSVYQETPLTRAPDPCQFIIRKSRTRQTEDPNTECIYKDYDLV